MIHPLGALGALAVKSLREVSAAGEGVDGSLEKGEWAGVAVGCPFGVLLDGEKEGMVKFRKGAGGEATRGADGAHADGRRRGGPP